MGAVYPINKGVNKAIEFKGLKAQYIGWLAGGLVTILILVAVMYLVGVNSYLTLIVAVGGASALIVFVYRLSNTYGQFGLMKMMARRGMPKVVKARSRKLFRMLEKPEKL